MSNFGTPVEGGEGFVNKVYTGIDNFRVVSVCPNHEELKKIFGENAKEDTYILTNEEGQQQVKLVLYVDNEAEEGEPSIKTRVTFFVTNAEKLSQTGKKQFINLYGTNAWLNVDGSVPDNMKWYDTKDNRPAFDGEGLVIDFIRNLNYPGLKRDELAVTPSQFSTSDWNAMFNGNFSTIKAAIMGSPNKIGLVLGAKTVDDGKIYQDVYNRNTLRQWSKATGKFEYIREQIVNSQNNGAYPKTDFGNFDFKLREYNPDAKGATNESLLSAPAASPNTSFFASANADTMGK